jgi:urease accessory protein
MEAQLSALPTRGDGNITYGHITYGGWAQKSAPATISRGGEIRLALSAADGHTRLADLYQAQPLRVLFPIPARGDIFQAAIACVSGGLVGGDRLKSTVAMGKDARALVIGQAAEKIYRSLGVDCLIENRLSVGEDAWLEFLPQETILFDAARLRRNTNVTLAPGARFMGGDIIVFGRKARGETLASGLLHDAWEIHREGKLVWKDALHLDGDLAAQLSAPAAFDGAAAYASLIYAGADAAAHLAAMRALAAAQSGEQLRIGATHFRDLLILRFIARDALALRKSFTQAWAALRAAAAGLPPALPRLWAI